ncbi:GM21670 [Drosophila sechellia]|uniref:GM21670 n=1 Tax=Drosophila sechellia TaxID=7238 RepID=B4HSS9_DROSE|nr:GM21670 [Drosophila sechellia]
MALETEAKNSNATATGDAKATATKASGKAKENNNTAGGKKNPESEFESAEFESELGQCNARLPTVRLRRRMCLAGGPAIEDYELPARFARKPIDAEEAAYINNGGIPK